MQYADNNLAAWRVSGLVNRKSRWAGCERATYGGEWSVELDSPLLLRECMKVRIEIDTETDKVEVKKDEAKVESNKTMNLNEVVKEEAKGQAINE